MKPERWHPTQRFVGVMLPRFDDQPNGPKMQSMSVCVCGAWWKDHAFTNGACPMKPEEKRNHAA